MSASPVITIITVVYNASAVVERTMISVAEQSWPHIEHLVVDGLSRDNTLEIVNRFARPELRVISEKDNGIYEAMNKGQAVASGEFVLFLNAGDEFYSKDTLKKIMETGTDEDVYYGNTMVVDENGKELGERRLTPPTQLNWRSLQMGMCVSHQSLLVRKSICVPYNLEYKISSDIDWTIRVLKNAKKVVNTKIYISKFLEGGVSSSQRKQGLSERFEILAKHYGWAKTVFNHGLITIRFVVHKITKSSMT